MEQGTTPKDPILTAIRLGLTAYLFYVSFKIIEPFMIIVIWGAIIATALYPLHKSLTIKLRNNQKYSSLLITLIALAVLIVPTYMLAGSLISTTQSIGEHMADGSLTIPEPSKKVAEWPVIGEKAYALWSSASRDIEALASKNKDQIQSLSTKILAAAASTAKSIFIFIFSIIVAGILLNYAQAGSNSLYKLFNRLAPGRGERLVNSAGATVQSVAKGVLGTALIQTALGTLGMVVVGVPGVGLWAILVLLVAIIQLPPILILGPVAAYVFSVEPSWVATIFLIYSIIVSSSDAVLKPLLLGRGVELPMLVILLGAIGGMIYAGIVGLFAGAVFLALAYQLYVDWLNENIGVP